MVLLRPASALLGDCVLDGTEAMLADLT